MAKTLQLNFSIATGKKVMLTVDADKLGDVLKWEASTTGRRGDFPHLYGPLPLSAVTEAVPFDGPE